MLVMGFDIETIPSQKIPEACIPKFNPDDIKLGNLKDPIKVEERLAAERDAFNEKLAKKMSTDPTLAQVCTFAGCICDVEPGQIVETKDQRILQLTEEDEHDDYAVVSDAWEFIFNAYNQKIPIVTYNGQGFDLQVLFFRAMILDIPINRYAYQRFMAKYKNPHHYDLMQILAGWDRSRWNQMEFYLNLFQIGTKGGMSGADVYPAYLNKEYDKIKTYCLNDAAETINLFARTMSWILYEVYDS